MPNDHYIEALESLRERPELARERTTRNALRVAIAALRAQHATATTPCKGMNCGCTDGRSHPPECEAQHAATVAGGTFVPAAETLEWTSFGRILADGHIELTEAGKGLLRRCAAATMLPGDEREAAWQACRELVGTEGWTASEAFNFKGFFEHGWRAARAALAAPAAPQSANRPSSEWYAAKIRETLDADFSIGHQHSASQEQPSDEDALTQALKERDDAEDMADQLAAQIAAITGEEIGEHTSANEPWRNAMLAADDFIAEQIRKLCSAPPKQSAPQAGEDAQPVGEVLSIEDEDMGMVKVGLYGEPPKIGSLVYATPQPAAIAGEFLDDLARSRNKYPGIARMFDGLMGEVDELRRAYNGDGDIRAEAFDVAVCAYRIATEGDDGGNTMLEQPAPQAAPAVRDVLAERRRQQEIEGWTSEHDDEHDGGEMAAAGASYALNAADQLHPFSQGDGGNEQPDFWPWDGNWWKPTNPRRDLVKAGALILAEIERLDRTALTTQGDSHE